MNIHIKYPRAKPHFTAEDKSSILNDISGLLDSGMLTQGPYVAKFEAEFKSIVGTEYAIATSSCTSALEIAIRSLGLHNSKILVTTNTWMSCANTIILTGNIPVFVDIDPNTLCMNPKSVLEKIETDNISAVLWVHMAGLISPDFINIVDICKTKGIYIIEDCAHAHGAILNNKMAGSLGDVGCFSFYPTKIIATGEGGMITTNNKLVNDIAIILRSHGTSRNKEIIPGLDYGVTCHYPSQNFRMTEISAILGLHQIKHINEFVALRNNIAELYRNELSEVNGISLLPKYKGHSYWNFYIILDKNINRELFAKILLYEFGIQTANAYDPPGHKQRMYEEYINDELFPIADNILSRHISLPMYVTLNKDDISYISENIKTTIININGQNF